MVRGQLPDEGPARLGPVTLPAGMLVPDYGGTDHVAWTTMDDPVPESARVWAALSELHRCYSLLSAGRQAGIR